jgi:hypothetical protein
VGGVGTGEESQPGSSRTLNRSPSGDDKFWVPPNLKRQASVCHSENADTSGGKFLLLLYTVDHKKVIGLRGRQTTSLPH